MEEGSEPLAPEAGGAVITLSFAYPPIVLVSIYLYILLYGGSCVWHFLRHFSIVSTGSSTICALLFATLLTNSKQFDLDICTSVPTCIVSNFTDSSALRRYSYLSLAS